MEGQIDYTKNNLKYFKAMGIPVTNTLTNMPANTLRDGRRVGNTTRLMNHAIDLLFQGYIVQIYDHNREPASDSYLFRKVLDRLRSEFKNTLPDQGLVIDKPRLMLYIKPQ